MSLDSSLASDGICLFVDLWEAPPCPGTQNEIVVSWITLWGMMKVYWLDLTWLDLTLAYILDHAVCCASAASSGRSLHLIISQLIAKHSSSNCPNHVQWSKSSIKKQIIVRQTVHNMFGEQTVRPVKNGFKTKAILLQGNLNHVGKSSSRSLP